jgi:hypothetical protein
MNSELENSKLKNSELKKSSLAVDWELEGFQGKLDKERAGVSPPEHFGRSNGSCTSKSFVFDPIEGGTG